VTIKELTATVMNEFIDMEYNGKYSDDLENLSQVLLQTIRIIEIMKEQSEAMMSYGVYCGEVLSQLPDDSEVLKNYDDIINGYEKEAMLRDATDGRR
jgi:hypothetical protein